MSFASRQGDPTDHGSTISTGSPTVFIVKKPAASVGDAHTGCPLSNGPVKHGGGAIVKGSFKVFINKRPAARAGDPAPCIPGGPCSIQSTQFKVIIK
jgi:uncharacterized Zn-binding protein involved in type VI secretion